MNDSPIPLDVLKPRNPSKGRPRKFKSCQVAIRITKYTRQLLQAMRPGAPVGRIIREIVESQADFVASKLGKPLPRM